MSCLRLKYDESLSNFAFNIYLRRYSMDMALNCVRWSGDTLLLWGRGLLSFTLKLNLSRV